MNTTTIKPFAQVQTLNGVTYEFQPEHLLCEECWNCASNHEAIALAHVYGSATACGPLDHNFKHHHSLDIRIISKGESK